MLKRQALLESRLRAEKYYLVICKDQVTSLGTGFEGEPIRGCVTV
jgi:hypothetical protein